MIAVRRLRLSDHALAVAVVRALKPEAERRAHDRIAEALESFLQDDANCFVVACEGNRPVGFAFGYVLPRIDALEPMIYLHEIAVAAAYRRQGVGRELVQVFESLGRTCHGRKLFMLTDANNLPARRLFASIGARESPSCSLFEYVWS